MINQKKDILKYVIKYFSKYNKNVPKILVQKAIYFLNFIGIDTGFRFQGDQYGPFSMDIVNIVDEMEISQEIKINGANYILNENSNCQEFYDLKEKLQIYYERILNKDISFDNIEFVGIMMFVMKNHEYGNIENIIDDVEKWKPDKYSTENIIAIAQVLKVTKIK